MGYGPIRPKAIPKPINTFTDNGYYGTEDAKVEKRSGNDKYEVGWFVTCRRVMHHPGLSRMSRFV
jgi:hypothetical protein